MENQTKKKIYLVDDEPLVLKALRRVLREQGYQISSFGSADEAIRAIAAEQPDCVISDFYMPGMDGLEFLHQVAVNWPKVFRVMLTGGYIDDRVREAVQTGDVQILMKKPWRVEDIKQLMEAVEKGEARNLESTPEIKSEPVVPQMATSETAADQPLVIVVDDDQQIRDLLKLWLEQNGYRMLGAERAEPVLEMIRDHRPVLVIVDLVLPRSSGLELTRAIRDLHPELPVLAITGHREKEMSLEAFRCGVTSFLFKPFDMNTLASTIRRCLQYTDLLKPGGVSPEIRALIEVQNAIVNRLPLDRILYLTIEHMIRISGADSSSIMLLEPEGKTLKLQAAYGLDGIEEGRQVALDQGVAGWVVKFNQPQLIVGRADAQITGERPESALTAAVGLCLPLRGARRVVGVLSVTKRTSTEPFPPGLTQFGLLLGAELARAIEELHERERHQEAERELMRRDKLVTIGELVAGVAHEINNPLGFIRSNLQTISEYLEELQPLVRKSLATEQPRGGGGKDLEFILEDLPSCLQETCQGVERVLKIVANLKSMAREDTDMKEMANINEILESAISILWNQIKYKAEIVREMLELPHYPCYPSQLGQVFLNIIHNAVQAIERRGRIWVRTRLESQWLVIEIQDDGCGMGPDTISKLFTPFFTKKPKGEGTGMGLKIAKKIVERHLGKIEVESQPGQGSLFRVKLPWPAPGMANLPAVVSK